MSLSRFPVHGIACFLAAVILAGCGNANGPFPVSGKVDYQGQPVKAGVITFIPEGAMASAGGAAITDGVYSIPAESGLPEGDYKVAISMREGAAFAETEAPGMSVESKETLPAKYNADTTLRAKVQRGTPNKFDFNLE